jgi:hypothetical protein
MRRLVFVCAMMAASGALEPARDAFIKGKFQQAIQLAEPHVKDEPDQAWRLIGGSSCFLKDKAGAMKAWNNLDTKGRAFLKYVCSRNGIELPDL